MENTFEQMKSIVEEDAQRPFSRYPEVAQHLLSDSRVVESVQRRLDNNGQLENITSLGPGYSFYTGLQPICFEFSSVDGSPLSTDAFLVIANFDCRVVGIVDPFDRVQPNPQLPSVPPGERPFALSRPGTPVVTVDPAAMYALEVRSGEFFQRLRTIEPSGATTRCQYETYRGRNCIITTDNPMGGPDICDQWDDLVQYDEVNDDCGQ